MWWIIVSLILAGVVLMLVEMLLIPGVGVAGLLSLASFGAGCWYAFTNYSERAGWITTIISIGILVILFVIMLREKTWKRFELKTEIDTKTNEDELKVQVGEQGVSLTRLAPMGTARFGTLDTEVKSDDNAMVAPGTTIEITRIEDNHIFVKTI